MRSTWLRPGRINFVDQAERRRMKGQKGQQQGDDRQGSFAPRKKGQGLLFLSRRPDVEFLRRTLKYVLYRSGPNGLTRLQRGS